MNNVTWMDSPHFQFWERFTQHVGHMRFVMKTRVDVADPRLLRPEDIITSSSPTLNNMRITVTNFGLLFLILVDIGFVQMVGKYLNQDALENLFGLLRAVGHYNICPNNQQCEGYLKTLYMNGTFSTKIVGANCEQTGPTESYFDLQYMLQYKPVEVAIAEEDDALPHEVRMANIATVGGSFRAETIRNDVRRKMRGEANCEKCWEAINDDRFVVALDSLEIALLERVIKTYKKLTLVEGLRKLVEDVLKMPWNECTDCEGYVEVI